MSRKPVALTNWKMEMTIAESLAFLRRFQAQAGDLLSQVQVILCPPYTALYAMGQALTSSPIELGAQTVSAAAGGAHTGEISARLVGRRRRALGTIGPLGAAPPFGRDRRGSEPQGPPGTGGRSAPDLAGG